MLAKQYETTYSQTGIKLANSHLNIHIKRPTTCKELLDDIETLENTIIENKIILVSFFFFHFFQLIFYEIF